MGAKIKTQKNILGFKQNTKNSLDKNLTPKKSHAEFPSHKNFERNYARKSAEIYGNLRKLSYYNPQKSLLKSNYQKKYLPKFSYPKKSWNLKFQTQKNPSIISVTWNP